MKRILKITGIASALLGAGLLLWAGVSNTPPISYMFMGSACIQCLTAGIFWGQS